MHIVKKLNSLVAFATTLSLLLVPLSTPLLRASPAAPAATPYVSPWPRAFDRNGAHVIVYQPQVKSWRGYRSLIADTAVSIQQGDTKPVLGVISWHADTITDVSSRNVFVRNIEVVSSRFPFLDAVQEAAMQQRVRQVYPTMTFTISLDRMIASVENANAHVQTITVNLQPPLIFVSTAPAILLFVEGKPVLAQVPGTALQYVVNTNWDLFFDNSDYFLLDGKTWIKSKDLAGPWAATSKLPADFAKIPRGQNWDDVLKAVPAPAAAAAPKVFFTEKPAELLLFKGAPVYAKIPGTALQYATNTESNVFLHTPDNQVYILLSGRRFRASTLAGPWTFASNEPPVDFSRLPPKQPYSVVSASVPGTQQASDAVLLAQVPTTAIVNRAQAESQVKVVYSGEPQFIPI